MAEKANVPAILDGKFFKICKTENEKVVADCCNCVNKKISGALHSTSNFRRHLKVSNCSNNGVTNHLIIIN